MIIQLTLTDAGADTGPFNLYSNTDSYTTPFETSISRDALLEGYTSTTVPTGTSTIRVTSTGNCTNHVDITVLNQFILNYNLDISSTMNGSAYIDFSGPGAPEGLIGTSLIGTIAVPEGVQIGFGISGTPKNSADSGQAQISKGAYPESGAPDYSYTDSGGAGSTVSTSYYFTMEENTYIFGLCDTY